MERQNEQTYKATRAEAAEIIKRAKVGSTFNVSIRIDLPIEGSPDHIFQDGGASYVSVSKKEALRLVKDLMTESLEKRGGRLPIRHYDRESYKLGDKKMVTSYWIG